MNIFCFIMGVSAIYTLAYLSGYYDGKESKRIADKFKFWKKLKNLNDRGVTRRRVRSYEDDI